MNPTCYFSFLFTFLLMIGSSPLQAQMFSDPIEYYNYIANEQNMVLAHHINYISYSVHSEDYRAIEIQRQQVVSQLETSIKKLSKVSPFGKNDKLKSEAIEVLNLYLETFNLDMNETLALKQDSKSSYEAMEKYFKAQDRAEDKLGRASDKFEKASKNFAETNELEFEDSDEKSSRKVRKIAEVNGYARELFLVYFKVSKYNASFIDALNEQKAPAMDKVRRELLTKSSEAMMALRNKKSFFGDERFLKSTKDLVQYYQSVAGDEYAKLTEVIKKQGQNKLTKEDVEYYNKTLEEMPQKEQELIDRFSSKRQQLLQKHVPNTTSLVKSKKGTSKI